MLIRKYYNHCEFEEGDESRIVNCLDQFLIIVLKAMKAANYVPILPRSSKKLLETRESLNASIVML